MSSKRETLKRIWKRVFPSFVQIDYVKFRESNFITVITVTSIIHFTLHEIIPVHMVICSTQSTRKGLEKLNKVYMIKLLITGEGEYGFYTLTVQKTLPKNVIFCLVIRI